MKNWHRSRSFFEALAFALRGVATAILRERNVRIQVCIGTIILFMMILFHVPLISIAIGVIAILLILAFEMLNTAIELIADMIHPEYSIVVRNAKDISAGAVLVVTIAACIVGILIFLPNIF
ncbi:MAG TPA: diacylglycerol kinase family protein [Candidatus Andersenbacteria bacterium]|nr:diacylglycerol kinase family protein [Candidatus Andersenbacteria bacterium]